MKMLKKSEKSISERLNQGTESSINLSFPKLFSYVILLSELKGEHVVSETSNNREREILCILGVLLVYEDIEELLRNGAEAQMLPDGNVGIYYADHAERWFFKHGQTRYAYPDEVILVRGPYCGVHIKRERKQGEPTKEEIRLRDRLHKDDDWFCYDVPVPPPDPYG